MSLVRMSGLAVSVMHLACLYECGVCVCVCVCVCMCVCVHELSKKALGL